MKKLFSIILSLSLISAATAAFADDDGEFVPEIDRGNLKPVVVDENFDTDRQDFLTDETVKNIRIVRAQDDNQEVTLTSGTSFLDENQRVRVPLRDVAEQLGYNVHWYDETGQIVISNEDEWYTFTPDDNIVVCKQFFGVRDKNDNRIVSRHLVMDCTPEIVDDVTYLPLRNTCDVLGRSIYWDTENLTAELYNYSVLSYGKGTVYIDVNESELADDLQE
jgi:hypothetical protein